MKELLYRLPSSRSFAKLFSIFAVAVVAFAALELLFAQQALAGIACCKRKTDGTTDTTQCYCKGLIPSCPSTYPVNTGKYCGVSGRTGSLGTINSEIECTARIGNTSLTTLDSTSLFSRSAILDCVVTGTEPGGENDGPAVCKLDLSYSRPAGLTQCVSDPDGDPLANPPIPPNYTLSYAAFCDQVGSGNAKNRLTVAGTLNCGDPTLNPDGLPAPCDGNPDCILRLGIADQAGECSELFPALANDPVLGLPVNLTEGQVLKFSTTVELVQGGSSCTNPLPITGPVIGNGPEGLRYCNGNSFNNTPVDCTFGTGKSSKDATVVSATEVAIPFDVNFLPPETHNVSCQNSQDIWDFTIIGNKNLDVTMINVGSLAVEGVSPAPPNQITCDQMGNNLLCEVKACAPDSGQPPTTVGAALKAARDSQQRVDITVTGTLLGSGTPIFGEQNIATSGN
jgi:hypothetical protein